MDDNLKEVLLAVIALVSAIVTPLVVVYVSTRTNKKIDGYHREVNGNMAKLIETTAELATATEKAKHKAK